uniref:Putative secreted protein n=1 Tax=Psorophora albipes TaxID=869069 RepID=T1E3I3_9DIPT
MPIYVFMYMCVCIVCGNSFTKTKKKIVSTLIYPTETEKIVLFLYSIYTCVHLFNYRHYRICVFVCRLETQ